MTFHPLKLQNETYQYISLESGFTDEQIQIIYKEYKSELLYK